MAQPALSEKPLPPPPTTDNPIVAIGRKVKSILNSSQQPSVRILRDSPSIGGTHRGFASQDFASQPQSAQQSVSSKDNTFSSRFRSLFSHEQSPTNEKSFDNDREYDRETVDLLDVVDPEVATLSTLTNVQNSLFVPSLGKLLDRQPAYRISETPREARMVGKLKNLLKNIKTSAKDKASIESSFEYAVLPDDEKLEGWTKEEKEELDDMVRHQLHSRRAKFRRAMKGFGQYVRRPLGLFITVYATLITLFGAAWVFFLIGWISLGSKQSYVINVVDNVLVALFAIIGDGLAPFRAVDTYHMIYIAYYHRQTWKRRENLGLPELLDHNDLPEQPKGEDRADLESQVARKMPRNLARRVAPHIPKKYASRILSRHRATDPGAYEYSVLTPEQQAKLEYHERKFSKSHTFYKPHETETHFAFPLKLLVAVVILLDLHSCLQITLGACTWGIPYQTRPFALTTVILCFSITCNILGGVLISQGDKRTRKHEVIERMMRQELTSEAIEEMRNKKMKEAEERGEIHPDVRKRMEEEKEGKENEEIKKSWKSVPLLPKTLLGKGIDHRQPALPREERRGSSNVNLGGSAGSGLGPGSAGSSKSNLGSKSSLSVDKKSRSKSKVALDPVHENLAKPEPIARRGDGGDGPAHGYGVRGCVSGPQQLEVQEQGKGQKVLAFFRKADLDRS